LIPDSRRASGIFFIKYLTERKKLCTFAENENNMRLFNEIKWENVQRWQIYSAFYLMVIGAITLIAVILEIIISTIKIITEL
jgi:hypothetical protein